MWHISPRICLTEVPWSRFNSCERSNGGQYEQGETFVMTKKIYRFFKYLPPCLQIHATSLLNFLRMAKNGKVHLVVSYQAPPSLSLLIAVSPSHRPMKFEDLLNHSRQGLAKRRSPGLVHFVPALAYLFCLALPAAFTQI